MCLLFLLQPLWPVHPSGIHAGKRRKVQDPLELLLGLRVQLWDQKPWTLWCTEQLLEAEWNV